MTQIVCFDEKDAKKFKKMCEMHKKAIDKLK